jgi:GNAT superfamily N-acetyltransferase
MSAVHPLARVIEEAERGRFPRPDGRWSRAPLWRPGLEAVVAFTAHAVFCLGNDITDDRLRELGANGYGGAHDPRLITAVAGPAAHIGSLDLLFVARGRGNARGGTLVPRPDLLNHPRVKYAARFKDDLDVFGFDDAARSAVVILGRGVARLPELSIELEADRQGRGEGRALAAAALAHLPRGSLVVACVAPGNAASVRSFLHAGFTPIGSVQFLQREGA